MHRILLYFIKVCTKFQTLSQFICVILAQDLGQRYVRRNRGDRTRCSQRLLPVWKLWWKTIPAKVLTFSSKAIRERLAINDNLLKRGIFYGVGTGVYSMCWGLSESSNHLLFSCLVALLISQAIVLWLDKSMLYSSSARDHYVEFMESESGNVKRRVADLIWQATFWKIWKVRNGLNFKESSYTLDELIGGIKFCLWKWIYAHYLYPL